MHLTQAIEHQQSRPPCSLHKPRGENRSNALTWYYMLEFHIAHRSYLKDEFHSISRIAAANKSNLETDYYPMIYI
jgi:hypothetical protein